MKRTPTLWLLAGLLATGAQAQSITDPTDTFSFSGTFAGAVETTAGAFYVWGLDRGVGAERFVAGSPSVGQSVKFDAAVFLRSEGTARVITLAGSLGTGVELAAGSATIAGNTISGSISGALLPSTGFAKAVYTWNLWPRIGSTNNTISDFAPDAMNVTVAAVPEPATYALMGLGLGLAGIGFVRRRQTRPPLAA